MLRQDTIDNLQTISTHCPIKVKAQTGLTIGSWQIETSQPLTDEKTLELIAKSVALQIVENDLDSFMLQVPAGADEKIYLKIIAALQKIDPDRDFFCQSQDNAPIKSLTFLSTQKFAVAKKVENEALLNLQKSLKTECTFLIGTNKATKKLQIFVNMQFTDYKDTDYQKLYSTLSAFIGLYPDYEIILGGNFTGKKTQIPLHQFTNGQDDETPLDTPTDVDTIYEKNGSVTYLFGSSAHSYTKQDNQLIENEEGLIYFKNPNENESDVDFKPTLQNLQDYNLVEKMTSKMSASAIKNIEESKIEVSSPNEKLPEDKKENSPLTSTDLGAGKGPTLFQPKPKELAKEETAEANTSLKSNLPHVNYLKGELLLKVTTAIEEKGLTFSEKTKNAPDKRDVIDKTDGQVRFSVHEKKFTTQSNDQANFETMLKLFQQVHGEGVQPSITAPNEDIKLIWENACKAVGFSATCVKLVEAAPQESLRMRA